MGDLRCFPSVPLYFNRALQLGGMLVGGGGHGSTRNKMVSASAGCPQTLSHRQTSSPILHHVPNRGEPSSCLLQIATVKGSFGGNSRGFRHTPASSARPPSGKFGLSSISPICLPLLTYIKLLYPLTNYPAIVLTQSSVNSIDRLSSSNNLNLFKRSLLSVFFKDFSIRFGCSEQPVHPLM